VLLGQDEERMRVAHELHDDISQRLFLALIELKQAEQLVRGFVSRDAEQRLSAVRGHVESIAEDIRRISRNLHPTMLMPLGLGPAVRELCREFSQRTHIRVECTIDLAVPLQQDVAHAVYRVAQECLSNVAKHSGSDQAHVALTERAGVLDLTVVDWGTGFDINDLPSKAGLGLVSLRERARRMGGSVEIASEPGHGTTVTVHVPLNVALGS
jgi:two-component system sensor histidine kinase UhpB